MRVVLLSKTFVADAAQRQLEWLACQPDIELALVTPPCWRADDGRALRFTPRHVAGYAVRQVPVRWSGHYHLYTYRHLGATLEALCPDLLHLDEEPYNPATAQAQAWATRAGVPTVVVAWQNVARRYPPPYRWIERAVYQRTAHIIAGNAAAAEVLRRKGYRGALSVFSLHGVDPAIFHPGPPRPTDGRFVVGYVGRLVRAKGIGVLLAALAGLPEKVTLRVIGDGPDAAALGALAAAYGVRQRVRFEPAVAASAVPAGLAGLDALALPSLTTQTWKEQFGRVLIEAMACGVPVVGSSSGEIPRVIGAAGLVVPEGDARALRVALRRLMDEPELRAQLATTGRARVLARFTQQRVARRLAGVYRAVLGGAARPLPREGAADDSVEAAAHRPS